MLTENQIQFLNRVCPNSWTEENDVIDVNGGVAISHINLNKFSVQFGRIRGDFYCYHNKLTTLKGCPSIIEGYFNCDYNQLTTLEGGPKYASGYYSCSHNRLTSLIGAPEICNVNFYCNSNQLTSLEGCPKLIKYNLDCRNNPDLKYLWGIGRVEHKVDYDNRNEINVWIIKCAQRDLVFPHFTLEENINWIMRKQKYSYLLEAPQKIRERFSPRIQHLVDSGIYNESRILDYKKFSRVC